MTLYDPRRPEVVADPYPVLCRLREEDPVHWSEILGGWILTRYADVRMALADSRLSADRITPFLTRQAATASEAVQALLRQVGRWVVFTDPPVHTRLRGVLGRAFSARMVELRSSRIRAIVDRLLAQAAAVGEMDLIRDFAYPLPVAVIGDLLGVPPEDGEQLINAANRDPGQFADPDRLDVRRADNRHLGFGHGIHFCLGAPLARLEGQIGLPALLGRFPAVSTRDDAPKWLDSLVFRGMRSLPIALG